MFVAATLVRIEYPVGIRAGALAPTCNVLDRRAEYPVSGPVVDRRRGISMNAARVGIGIGVGVGVAAAGIGVAARVLREREVTDEEFADLARGAGYGMDPNDAWKIADASKRPLAEDYEMLRTAAQRSSTDVLELYRMGADSSLTTGEFDTLVGAAEIYRSNADPALVRGYIDGSRFSLDEYVSILKAANGYSDWGDGVGKALEDAESSGVSAKAFIDRIKSGRYSNGAVNA